MVSQPSLRKLRTKEKISGICALSRPPSLLDRITENIVNRATGGGQVQRIVGPRALINFACDPE
jgi:hypothetical protein